MVLYGEIGIVHVALKYIMDINDFAYDLSVDVRITKKEGLLRKGYGKNIYIGFYLLIVILINLINKLYISHISNIT